MAQFIRQFLEIDEKEEKPVLLLLANSFFIGTFIVSYDVSASTLFLDQYGNEFLTRLPIFSGILGMIVTSIFAWLQRRVLFTYLALSIFMIVTLLVSVLYVGIVFFDLEIFKFLGYLFLFPINTLFILCFYGTVSRSFSLKREKHMTGTVDQGQMIATAISFFAVFGLSTFNLISDVTIYFLASIVSGLLAFLFMAIFVIRYSDKALLIERKTQQAGVAKIGQMASNPYIRMLCLLFLGSVLTTQFLEFSFLSVTVSKYTDESSLSAFLGLFGGLVTIVSLILQTAVADRVIKMYGMRIGLIIIPVILGVFTLLSSLIGTIFGYDEADSSFILFFLFMAMSKLFLQALKESFEDPVLKTLFIPLDSFTRFDVQTKVEGFVKEFSAFVAGTLLTLLGILSFFDLIFYSYFLIALCIGYFYIVLRLFVEYRKNLTSTLEVQKSKAQLERKDYEVTDVLLKELESNDTKTSIYSLKLMEKMEPVLAETKFLAFLQSQNPELVKHSVIRLHQTQNTEALDQLKSVANMLNSAEIKSLAIKAISDLEKIKSIQINQSYLYNLVKSRVLEDRWLACNLISKERNDHYLPLILLLLRDGDIKIRKAAIRACAKFQKPETYPIIIEYLASYSLCNLAASTLIAQGEKVLPSLEAAFYKTGQVPTIQEKIIQIYGRIRGAKVIDLLWNKIDFPDKKIVNNILLCLSSIGFRPVEGQVVRIKQAIEAEIGNTAWNMAALSELPVHESATALRNALQEEIDFNFENIYMLLALIYDPQSIKLVKDNIDSNTVEGLVFAVELMDVFLDDGLKPILIPLVEDITQRERSEKLQSYFPRTELTSKEVLIQIINRDYNSINKWSKATAMYAYTFLPDKEVTNDLIANLFNPDPLLREVAAWVIYSIDVALYHRFTYRLSDSTKKELDALFIKSMEESLGFKPMTRLEKIMFLKRNPVFTNVPGAILVEFVELVEEVYVEKGSKLLFKGATSDHPLYMLVSGKAVVWEKELDVLKTIESSELIGEELLLDDDEYPYTVEIVEDAHLFKIDKDRFLEQIYDNFEIAQELLRAIETNLLLNDLEPMQPKP